MSRPKDGDFLGRWSTRKLRARAERAPDAALEDPPPDATDPEQIGAQSPDPEKTDAEILSELGLPDPDKLVKGDDFSAFLRGAVPARIRNRALRRLWLTDPVFANLDGLNDYDQDFTDAATVMPALKTAYRVGRGLLSDEPATPQEVAAEAQPQSTGASAAAVERPDQADDPLAAEVGVGDQADREDADGGPAAEPAEACVDEADRGAGASTRTVDRSGQAGADHLSAPDEGSDRISGPTRMRFRFGA